jgi:hypothetical protein
VAASDEIHDLDLIAIAHERCGEGMAFDDDHVVLDRNASGVDVQPLEQFLN